jgi:hypothetical protein
VPQKNQLTLLNIQEESVRLEAAKHLAKMAAVLGSGPSPNQQII